MRLIVPSVQKFLVTSALPYANGPIHLGHLAGAYLPADIFVRYHRLKGDDIIFICGSDEHGVPIMLRAREENKSPQDVVNFYHEKNKASFDAFGIKFDYYGRTSSRVHHQMSQEIFQVIARKDKFILKTSKQLYDPEANLFLADRFIIGTCPRCGYSEAFGDQCEKCGISLSPTELINPRSAITKAKPVLKESTHWYLPLADSQKALEKWINKHPEWKANVLGQIRSWLSEGLNDRAVTRDLSWGVPVPEDIAEEKGVDASGKVLYVWFDAPIGYISATKEWAEKQGDPDRWKKYWQEKDTKIIHFIGKDNIVFHCLIFPAMLMAHGDFVLPGNVPANEFLNLEGDKLSTSRNYAVWLDDYLKTFDPDPLRYCLASILPETRDTDFSWRDFQGRFNNELADILGNFINRTLTFVNKHFYNKVPTKSKLEEIDKEMLVMLEEAPLKIAALFEKFKIKDGVFEAMNLARNCNKYFNDSEPWNTVKSNKEKCGTTLNICLRAIFTLGEIFSPVIPFSSKKIFKMLNTKPTTWGDSGKENLAQGHQLNKSEIIFPKIEDEMIEEQTSKLGDVQQKVETKKDDTITIDDFFKVQLKVAEIIQAEKVEKSDKLMKLKIQLENEERQIIAGIAKHYSPEDLLNKKVVIVANLKTAKLMGLESQGMVLAVEDDAGKINVLTVDKSIKNGTRAK